ncbi:DUF2254 domain-containing protein [Corynebacterium ciconiae]|uniref:DUF2254 domain-containing protein n=1 Tax=Corynebacterium ciconiae TaxID=227319 RepID=UPI0003A71AC6|nr:DUF2254 domain-containing protein [Corynebacterium ciconiae]
MKRFLYALKNLATSKLWSGAAVTGIVAAIVAIVLTEVTVPGEYVLAQYLWPGDTDAAADMLSFVASSTMTVLTTTISMTLIVLQVASGNFSHQLLRDYIESPAVRGIIAVYVGNFVYAVLVLRSLDKEAESPPQLAVTVAVIGVLIALGTFIWYVSRVVDMVRVDTIIRQSATRTLAHAQTTSTDDTPAVEYERPTPAHHAATLRAENFGYVQRIDHDTVADWAAAHDATVVIDVQPGDRIIAGQPVAHWWCDTQHATHAIQMPDPIFLSLERVSGSDFALGLRQLLDIGVRALSPGVNDPTTARHAIGQATSVLRTLVAHPPRPVVRDDAHGRRVLWAAERSQAALIAEWVSEMRRYGAQEPGVLVDLLDLLHIVGAESQDAAVRAVVRKEIEAIVRAAERSIEEPMDRQRVLEAAGIGS